MQHNVVGLTGGIGSGKSTVASIFERYGVVIIDTDVIARELTSAKGDAMPALRAAFGDVACLTDGSLNRPYIRELIFSDAPSKTRLEKILHPLILSTSKLVLADAPSGYYTLLVVPLLFECYMDYRSLVRRTLLIDCDEHLQIQRIKKRNRFNSQQIDAVMASQYSREERKRYADDVIVNNGDIVSLSQQVEEKHCFYMHTLVHT